MGLIGLTDHINGDGLDNRRQNLRSCTHAQNFWNAQKQRQTCTSPYKGVTRRRNARLAPWQAAIRIDGKSHYLGSFPSEWEAAMAYNQAATEYFGAFARLNVMDGGSTS
jgi:hypothetical protein